MALAQENEQLHSLYIILAIRNAIDEQTGISLSQAVYDRAISLPVNFFLYTSKINGVSNLQEHFKMHCSLCHRALAGQRCHEKDCSLVCGHVHTCMFGITIGKTLITIIIVRSGFYSGEMRLSKGNYPEFRETVFL